MNTSKVKDVSRILRDYSFLVWPAIVLLVSVAILLITPLLMGSRLKDKISKGSLNLGTTVERLEAMLKADSISSKQVQVEATYEQQQADDANQVALLALQTTQRQLLSYQIFPEPKDATNPRLFSEFGRAYRAGIEKMLSSLNALDRPTKAELQRRLSEAGIAQLDSGGMPYPGSGGSASDSRIENAIIEALCNSRAESARVYANPATLPGYLFWDEQSSSDERGQASRFQYTSLDEAVEQCWYWQLGYWIVEDIIDTLASMNSDSSNVFDAPVKRLVSAGFSLGDSMYGGQGKSGRPGYVTIYEGRLVPSLTGRVSDDDVDVVHFHLSVIIRTRDLMNFMKKLCSSRKHIFKGFSANDTQQALEHNQITILQSSVMPVEQSGEEHLNYQYGSDAVVKLELVCEYVFKKKAYDSIKPRILDTAEQLLQEEMP